MNKRGMSLVVTTLIIILLAIVAVGIVWVVVKNIISKGKEDISLTGLTLDLEILKASVDEDTRTLSVTVKRKSGEGDLIGINFVISDGDNSVVVRKDTTLEELETKTFTFDLDTLAVGEITSISIASIYETSSGKETIGDIKDTATYTAGSMSSGNPDYTGTPNGEEPPGGNGEATCDPPCEEPKPICSDGVCVECLVNDDCTGTDICGEDNLCHAVDCTPLTPTEACVAPIECGIIYEPNCGDEIDCDAELGGCGDLQICEENICVDITYLEAGLVGNSWPPNTGMYFDSVDLTQTNGLHYQRLVAFPTVDDTQCFTIIDYNYDPDVYPDAVIVQLFLIQPLEGIINGVSYEIWANVDDCCSRLPGCILP